MHELTSISPIVDALSEEWFEASSNGRFLLQRCRNCSHIQYYPRRHCTVCMAEDPEWITSTGNGTLYSFSVVYRTPTAEFVADVPYALAIVKLDEGVFVTSRVVDTPFEDLCCDLRVKAVFPKVRANQVTLPLFVRSNEESA
jgi:uncharacterized OB-fold protein